MDNLENLPLYGLFLSQLPVAIPLAVLALLVIGYNGMPLIVWALVGAILLAGFGAPFWLLAVFAILMLIFLITPIRRALVSSVVMKILGPLMPQISATERAALEAGVTWVEKDLFSGKPDFKMMMAEPYPDLTAEEKAFLAGPVDELCAMIDCWALWKTKELDDKIWAHIKKHKFLGMIIPKEYGGLGFSALCHSEVVMKVASRSLPVCVTIMVPNSLGPGELLIHYGTDAQKKYYLPRLAAGEEIPCFGLTEPGAGSDAGSIVASGEVFKGEDGKLYIKLNWNKRWITLAAISTLVGLAFRLRDPKNYLGRGEDLGITCALIPAKTPGVVLGRRHDPMGTPFYNCPTQGKDVVVSMDAVVGGADGCGRGWQMLMESLAAGRGISLPAQSIGGAKMITRLCSAHAVIRQQFGLSIGKFEGVEEPLARIMGLSYGLEAMRKYTLGALDKGIKPGVITAMAKYYSTELGRQIVNDGMDVMGGAGISMGPRNLIAEIYIGTPIGITVEGANIMTRTLIIFGQGALRSHPYAFKEVDSISKKDLVAFDLAFWGHMGFIMRNTCRAICLSWTRGYIACSPVSGPTARYYRRMQWASASFAILADVAMGALGGDLKFREKITGRFADILSWMYIGTATLRRYEAEGRRADDLIYVHYVMKKTFFEIQKAFDGIYDNIKVPGLVWFFKGWLGAWSRINSMGSQASDGHGHRLVQAMLKNPELRNRHTEGIYIPKDRKQQMGRLDYAMEIVLKAEAAEKKIRDAIKAKVLVKKKMGPELIEDARGKNVISADEVRLIKEAVEVRWDAIQVDDFSQDEYHS
jgi:acyl-CoA dehydrogenase